MRIHTCGVEGRPVIIMLPGSFCNADTMANIITRLKPEFHILAVDYSGQYAGSETPFTSRAGESEKIIRYLREQAIRSVALIYGQSMGGEMGMELISQLKKSNIAVGAAFFDGGPFLHFPRFVSRLLGNKFKTIVGNLRGKTLAEALQEPTIVKFSGGKPERYSNMLGPICQNAAFMSDETLEREADACVTFDYPAMDRDFQKRLTFFYSKEESAWRFCHRKLQKSYPFAHYKLVSGYGHVGYPGEHLAEYCDWLSAAARGDNMTGTFKRTQELKKGETMATAQQIMKKKTFIKEEMDRQLTKKQSDYLWKKSTGRLADILDEYASLPKGVHTHTDSFIFPVAAIYLTAKEHIPADKAYSIIENSAIANTSAMGEKLAKMMKIPGMSSFFISLWDPISRKMFGESCGFQNVFYPREKGVYRMDIVACPYNRYFTELGCPELTKIFCENDERTYGHLPGLQFIRTSTLGKGGERCDFYLKKVKR